MRLLKVAQSYYPFLDKGGPTVKVRALARGMASFGHSVTVLTADYGLDAAQKKTLAAISSRFGYKAEEDGVETIYLGTRARYRALTWNPAVAAFCRERLASYDLVHIYGLYDLLGPCVARACRRIGRPYVLEPMGMFQPIIRNIQLKRLYHAVLGGAMIEGASRVIATSEQERQELLDGGIPDNKIVVRRNGIDVPGEFPPSGKFRSQWDISTDAKIVLFLGRLVSKKSPDMLLEAFSRWVRRSKQSRGSVLVVAGPDEGDGFRQRLEKLAARMGLNEGVLFTGPLYGDAKWAAYRDADLFVLPSQNENFGNTAAEAVACGTPVLVTDRCGIAPIVDRRSGLVVPHDCAALEAGLAKILDDPAFAAQLRAGCETVAHSLGWSEPLAEMQSLYRDVLLEGRPA
ncbi:MAG TPA: glycosyltransferase [Candidatus Dormibacteraeota bacterium]|nr:glycosyltransferase [Candidatus Dormibacteraeota bacterium]